MKEGGREEEREGGREEERGMDGGGGRNRMKER